MINNPVQDFTSTTPDPSRVMVLVLPSLLICGGMYHHTLCTSHLLISLSSPPSPHSWRGGVSGYLALSPAFLALGLVHGGLPRGGWVFLHEQVEQRRLRQCFSRGWSSFAPRGKPGTVWRLLVVTSGRRGCYWHLMIRGQGCCSASYDAPDPPPK